jgi:hypothetical protein
VYQSVGSYQFRDAPGLGEAAFRLMGWVAIEYLADLSEAAIIGKMLHQWLDKIGGLCLAFSTKIIDFQIRFYERSNQVWPNRALMISLVAMLLWAGVSAFVTAVGRG